MKRLALVLLGLIACTAIATPTVTGTQPTELIPSSTVTLGTAPTEPTAQTIPVTQPEPATVVMLPPVVTAVATTTTRTTTTSTELVVPTSPPITMAPELAVVFSAPSEALLAASTNLVRTSIGLPALIAHADLDFYARVWAGHLSRTGNLGHSDIASLLGPWAIIGENLGVGSDMGSITDALAASPSHYSTMIDAAFTHTGIGVAVDPSGKLWVCQVFGGTVLP